MVSAADVTQMVGNLVLYFLSLILRNLLVALQYLFVNYPEATRIAIVLLGFYIAYKLMMRIVRMWVRTLVFIIKTTLVFLGIFFMVALYLRGYKLISQDIPNLWHMFTDRDEYMKSSFEMYDRVNNLFDYVALNDQLREAILKTKKNVDEIMDNTDGLNNAKEYVNKYVDKDIQNSVKDFVQQGSAVAGQFMNYAQDNQNVRNFMNNLWN